MHTVGLVRFVLYVSFSHVFTCFTVLFAQSSLS